MRSSLSGIRGSAVLILALLVGFPAACRHAAPAPDSSPTGAAAEQERQRQSQKPAHSLEGGEIRSAEITRTEELFEGRFSGVRVLRHPGGGLSVRIRGASSVMGSNEPLYVVDGVPLDPVPGGALLGINPADIQRIEVLKDIGSTSFYGVRGANGVVLITTRH